MKGLEVQLKEILDEYSEEVHEAAVESINKVSRETVKMLKSTSPNKTGEYASGWKSKKDGELTVTVYNAKAPGLTHLLENGHIIKNQYGQYDGRTKSDSHIKDAETWANAELVREIEGKLP